MVRPEMRLFTAFMVVLDLAEHNLGDAREDLALYNDKVLAVERVRRYLAEEYKGDDSIW